MHVRWLIIDGYSLLHRDPKLSAAASGNLAIARQRLIRQIEEMAGSVADHITVVFDGQSKGGREGYESSAVEVIFSPSDKTADTIIERMAHEQASPEDTLVVTSDRMERETVSAAGAQTMSSGDFLDQCERQRAQTRIQAKGMPTRGPGPTLGDFFPKS